MLLLPLRLFLRQPEALRLYQDAYRHVLCDEAQDVCRAQYTLLRQLVARHRNLTVVGDPLQNLYRWRGADARLLLEGHRDLPGATVVELDENFRSSGRIVAVANALGGQLASRRAMRTPNPPGPGVVLRAAPDEPAEAAVVAEEVERLLAAGARREPGGGGRPLPHQPAGARAGPRLPEAPPRVRACAGATDFFARREVRDALAYLRLAHSPADGAALARVANAPPRGLAAVGPAAARAGGHPGGAGGGCRQRGPAGRRGAAALVDLVEALHAERLRRPPAALLDLALERSGDREWLAGQPDGPDRLARLDALRGLAARAGGDLPTGSPRCTRKRTAPSCRSRPSAAGDDPRRQGAGVPRRLRGRPGGGSAPPPADAPGGGGRPGRPWRTSCGWPTSPSPGPGSGST